MSFKQHPDQPRVAQDPSYNPSLLNVDGEGQLVVTTSPPPTDASGNVLVTSPTLLETLVELIKQVKKSNMYLSILVGEEIPDSDVEE